jgi:SAM-dependent methyltransferase
MEKLMAERNFWVAERKRYREWFEGKRELNGMPPLSPENAKHFVTPEKAWICLFQEPHYQKSLKLWRNAFCGCRVLEIGPGPVSGAGFFECAEIYGVDPLVTTYEAIGFEKISVIVRPGTAESIPFASNAFDAVISVNAIDHIDNPEKAAKEIRRILKPGGKFAMNVHYHKPLVCEPVEWDDRRFMELFGWVKGLEKIGQVEDKAIWRNF